MKEFFFDTPLTYQDGSPISAADLAALVYDIKVDTSNPPTTKYTVPAANVAAASTNANGSKHVTVLFTDIGFAPQANVTYNALVGDSLGAMPEDDSAIITFINQEVPSAPTGFGVA